MKRMKNVEKARRLDSRLPYLKVYTYIKRLLRQGKRKEVVQFVLGGQ